MVEVMLMADVKKLGKAGAIVKVAPGYARNFLFTQGLAAPVTEAAKRRLAKLEAERAKERAAPRWYSRPRRRVLRHRIRRCTRTNR